MQPSRRLRRSIAVHAHVHASSNTHARIVPQAKCEMTGPLRTGGHHRRQRGSSAPPISHSSAALSFPHFFFSFPPFFLSLRRSFCTSDERRNADPARLSCASSRRRPPSFLPAAALLLRRKACNYGLRCQRRGRERPSAPSLIHLTLTACGGLTPSLMENRWARNCARGGGGEAGGMPAHRLVDVQSDLFAPTTEKKIK